MNVNWKQTSRKKRVAPPELGDAMRIPKGPTIRRFAASSEKENAHRRTAKCPAFAPGAVPIFSRKLCGDAQMPAHLIDLTGQTFGWLRVLSHAGFTPGRQSKWACVCRCGREITVLGYSLTTGVKRSCGECTDHQPTARPAVTFISRRGTEGILRNEIRVGNVGAP